MRGDGLKPLGTFLLSGGHRLSNNQRPYRGLFARGVYGLYVYGLRTGAPGGSLSGSDSLLGVGKRVFWVLNDGRPKGPLIVVVVVKRLAMGAEGADGGLKGNREAKTEDAGVVSLDKGDRRDKGDEPAIKAKRAIDGEAKALPTPRVFDPHCSVASAEGRDGPVEAFAIEKDAFIGGLGGPTEKDSEATVFLAERRADGGENGPVAGVKGWLVRPDLSVSPSGAGDVCEGLPRVYKACRLNVDRGRGCARAR